MANQNLRDQLHRLWNKTGATFRRNVLLTTEHLSFFKPFKTPKTVMNNLGLHDEWYTINPFTSIVKVQGKILFTLPRFMTIRDNVRQTPLKVTNNNIKAHLKNQLDLTDEEVNKALIAQLGLIQGTEDNTTGQYAVTRIPLSVATNQIHRLLSSQVSITPVDKTHRIFNMFYRFRNQVNEIPADFTGMHFGTTLVGNQIFTNGTTTPITPNLLPYTSGNDYLQFHIEITNHGNKWGKAQNQGINPTCIIEYEYEFIPESQDLVDLYTKFATGTGFSNRQLDVSKATVDRFMKMTFTHKALEGIRRIDTMADSATVPGTYTDIISN